MALFPKPPIKKPEQKSEPPAIKPGRRPLSARELAAETTGRKAAERPVAEPTGDITVTGASLIEWSPQQSAFEVAQANPGLCSVLENAALMYASGQSAPARSLLEQGIATDHDAKLSPLAWLALFDVLQRENDRAAFDQLALQYVVQFERSAPGWEERTAPVPGGKSNPGGYIAITGKLSPTNPSYLDSLKRAIEKRVAQARLDLASIVGFDDEGAKALASLLAIARKRQMALALQRPDRLRTALETAVKQGKEGGEGAWLLSLELMQWERQQAAFDDRAVEYAVTFELSPPSWEPPPAPPAQEEARAGEAAPEVAVDPEADVLYWTGVLAGPTAPQLAKLSEFSQRRGTVPIDLSAVERVDFVCAGALLNLINRIENQRKSIQFVGASPIVRALLLLIGISPRHFVKRAQ
jgi:ABC-type transporter Mla MlaB component